jgi:hypothetical protein
MDVQLRTYDPDRRVGGVQRWVNHGLAPEVPEAVRAILANDEGYAMKVVVLVCENGFKLEYTKQS